MGRMRPAAVPEQSVPILTDEQLTALLAACKGNSFNNRRDAAIVRLFLDTGVRAGELAGLTLDASTTTTTSLMSWVRVAVAAPSRTAARPPTHRGATSAPVPATRTPTSPPSGWARRVR